MAFKKIENNQRYFKGVIFGDTGTGKTTLAERIAIGLATNTKKVYVIDTEGGIDFFAKNFQEAGIDCYSTDCKINSVAIFNENLKIALQDNPDVILIDSITHIGELYQQYYVNNNPAKDSMLNWGKAKKEWNENITIPLKEAQCHVIICGRETSGMSIEKKAETGFKTTITYDNPTKVRSGVDIDYEVNILINMNIANENGKQVRVAKILKDRSNKIDGMEFANPTFNDIKPHLEGLAKDSEIYLELKAKLEACESKECLESVKTELTEAKSQMSSREIQSLSVIFKSKLNNQ